MNTPTPTPRTDAATYPADCLGTTLVTNRDCARALERELTALASERDELRAALALGNQNFDDAYDELRADCDELRGDVVRLTAERDELRADCENETKWAAHYLADAIASKARAERAEAEIKDRAAMMRDVMRERDAAEISLTAERAIVSRIWVQLGSPTYAQLKGRSIYDLIDEIKTELASERARLDWLLSYDGVDWVLEMHKKRKFFEGEQDNRALLAVAMKEGAK